jgi:glycerol-3-phosphate dehydrogenase (NAD(P)+)
MAKITILGAGMMGSAIAVPFLDNGHDVHLVGTHLDDALVAGLQGDGVHPTLRWALPPSRANGRHAEAHYRDALGHVLPGSDLLVLGVSSAGLRWAGEAIAHVLAPGTPILAVTKGLEWADAGFSLLPDVLGALLPPALRDACPRNAVVGPCIAGELARRAESAVLFAGRDRAVLERLAALARTDYYHVHVSTDLAGAEVCAALKNAYAMAIGFAAGIHEARGGAAGSVAMHNFESAVFAQATREMARIVCLAGGEEATTYGLAGVGDLMVTCNGGRTGRFGRWLGTGLRVDEAVERMEGATLECLQILAVLDEALGHLEAAGRVAPGELPLLRHMLEVVAGAPVAVPFERFDG